MIGKKTLCHPIRSVIILVINKSDSRCTVVRCCYHLNGYRPNRWTPLIPITITNLRCCKCIIISTAFIGEVILLDEVDTRKQSWITYEMRIDQVIKKTKTNFAQGDFIEFKKRAGCACPKLVERKNYMIMANEDGPFFVFDSKSFVIPWEKRRKNKNMLDDLRARIGLDPRCTL